MLISGGVAVLSVWAPATSSAFLNLVLIFSKSACVVYGGGVDCFGYPSEGERAPREAASREDKKAEERPLPGIFFQLRMWKLSPATDTAPGQPYHLLVGVEYVVGRKNCAILIQEDQSISRSHAVLSVSHPQMNLSQSSAFPVLTLKDTSKYGTFVNEEKLPNGITRTLKSGDRVTFGVFESKYRVEYEPLVVCSSCLDVSRKSVLNKNILQLGGHVVNEWKEECSHLAMVLVKVTVKTICALICGRPIVKPEYFAELIKAIQAKEQLPAPESFYPPIDEPSIKCEKLDLATGPVRKTIFKGKTFVFLTAKQFAKLSLAIKLGGGEAKLMTEEAEVTFFPASDVCVIEVGLTNSQASISDLEKKWMDTITAVLQRKKCRTISEAEIGLAVIFASTERYCNPQTPLDTGVKPAISARVVPGPSLSHNVVVDETVMATIADDIAAYVADTEMDQPMDTCVEIEGEKRNKGTPIRDPRRKTHPQNITTVKETPAGTGTVNVGTTLSRLNTRPGTGESSLSFSPSKMSGNNRNKGGEFHQQLNSIKNYFQTAIKKRERDEVGETSVTKYAKIEEKSSQASSHTQPVTSLLRESSAGGSQKGPRTLDQKTNESYTGGSRKSILEKSQLENNNNENIYASKKRKELNDSVEDEASLEVVFASQELDWEEDVGHDGEGSAEGAKKKRKLETKEENSTDEAQRLLQENKQSLPNLNQKQEIKEESPGSVKNDANNPDKCAGDSSNLPSRLLLTEFRSLVVSQPRKDGHCTAKTDYGHLNNFKQFKKVAYPGAGQLPHIIGGSDLIAHHTRKNSEMEEWLKQEMEEQSRHAKEESLADDLFRYDPHVKRR
ncbi:nibrin isoform X2 [Rhineura floridana]|uniref:nibrin isoform X2 n=1 Tax=Rhineura floridana TaxID=261503 RepID=UPI002AC837C7|nr:nibrin isoform X2 [Rhineura floridana]